MEDSISSEEERTSLLTSASSSSTQSDREDEEKEPKLSAIRQNVILVTILSLQCFSLCADTLIAPFFPNEAMNKGLSNTYSGIVFSSFEIARFVASPIAGSILDRYGPKNMCLLGNTITATACITFGTLIKVNDEYLFFTLCVITRLIAGIGSAMLSVASTSILMKVTSYKSGTIVGLLEITSGAGFALGPVYGAGLYTIAGYAPMFWILGGLMLVFLPVFMVTVPKVEDSINQNKKFLGLLAIPGCTIMLITAIVNRICGSTRTTGISDWITTQYDKPPSFVGLMFGMWAVLYIVGCSITSRLVNKGYGYQLMIGGSFISVMPCLLTGPSHLLDFILDGQKALWQSVLGMTLMYISAACVFVPPLQAALDMAYVNGYSKDSVQTYGMVTGFINSGLSLGAAVGPTMSGAITDALDFSWSMTVVAFLSFIIGTIILIYWTYMRCTNQPLTPGKATDCDETTNRDSRPSKTADNTSADKHISDTKETRPCVINYGTVQPLDNDMLPGC